MPGTIANISAAATGSALLGTNKSLTVLGVEAGKVNTTLFGDLGSTTGMLLQQVTATANQRLADAQNKINEAAKQRLDAINLTSERWIAVKAKINLAQAYVTAGQDNVKRISDTILQLRIAAASAGEPKADIKYWREQYDLQANKLNIFAETGSPASNLIGSINRVDYTPNKVEYRTDLGTGTTTLRGTYAGFDFRIEGDDGTVWVPDLSADVLRAYSGLQGGTLKYTTADGQKVDRATSTRNGLKLVSYDAKSQQITLHVTVVPTEPPVVVTGKLKTSGIGVMQAWFYNGFESTADRERALKDLSAAAVNLTSVNAHLHRAKTQVEIDQRRVNRVFDDLGKQSSKTRSDQQIQLEELRIKTAQQYLAMQANLKNLQSVQSNYLNAFGGFVTNPFSQAFLNITA
jgi:hypothetical protein